MPAQALRERHLEVLLAARDNSKVPVGHGHASSGAALDSWQQRQRELIREVDPTFTDDVICPIAPGSWQSQRKMAPTAAMTNLPHLSRNNGGIDPLTLLAPCPSAHSPDAAPCSNPPPLFFNSPVTPLSSCSGSGRWETSSACSLPGCASASEKHHENAAAQGLSSSVSLPHSEFRVGPTDNEDWATSGQPLFSSGPNTGTSDRAPASSASEVDPESWCLNLTDVEVVCNALDAEGKMVEGVIILPVASQQLGLGDEELQVALALIESGNPVPLLPGSDWLQMLAPTQWQGIQSNTRIN